MQLTIDSTEPLDRVLKVVSSLYGVELAVVSTSEQPAGESAARQKPSTPRAQTRRTAKKSAPAAAPVRKTATGNGKTATGNGGSRQSPVNDLGAVRSWARANGFQVSDRGRVSNAVLQAFKAGNRPAS